MKLQLNYNVLVTTLALVLLGIMVSSASAAPWTRRCNGPAGTTEERCFVQQKVSVGQQVIIVSSFGTSGPDRRPLGTITIPLNSALKPGLSVWIDNGSKVNFQFDFCTRQGCRVSFGLDGKLLENLLSGNALNISWIGLDTKEVQLRFDLQGFKTAWSSVSGSQ